MSIASSRRGRKQFDRDSDTIEVVGDFCAIVKDWKERTYKPDPSYGRLLDDGSGDSFEIQLDCLSVDGWNELITLTDRFQIPEGLTIPRGQVAVFRYTLKCENRAAILAHATLAVDDDARILDLIESREASEEEIAAAVNAERPAPRTKAPKPALVPTYKRIPRTEGDNASRLGFTAGSSDMLSIKVGEKWGVHAFHLASSQIAGRLAVSLSIHPLAGQTLEVALFDALGNDLLALNMQTDSIRFDQIRLAAGDYLIAWRSPGPGCRGTGSYHTPNSRLSEELPAQPLLDDILSQSSDVGECGTPKFEFGAK